MFAPVVPTMRFARRDRQVLLLLLLHRRYDTNDNQRKTVPDTIVFPPNTVGSHRSLIQPVDSRLHWLAYHTHEIPAGTSSVPLFFGQMKEQTACSLADPSPVFESVVLMDQFHPAWPCP